MKNILVVGGAGFLGSHLCEALVAGAHVVCMDNFCTSTPANIQPLLQHPRFELIRHDINEPFDLASHRELDRFHVRVHGIQEVYYLASPTAKHSFQAHKLTMMRTASVGLLHVLERVREYEAKFLLVSTSALYADQNQPFLSEDDPCVSDHLGPYAAYDESKRFEETLVHTHAEVCRLPGRIVRLFRTYGPRMRLNEGYLLPDMIQSALAHRDLELPFSEDACMSLCYVNDAIEGCIRTMGQELDTRVMNIGSDQEVRLGMVVARILELTHSTARIRFLREGVHRVSAVPNLEKARQLLHWLPLTRLDDGLLKMIDFIRSKEHEVDAFAS